MHIGVRQLPLCAHTLSYACIDLAARHCRLYTDCPEDGSGPAQSAPALLWRQARQGSPCKRRRPGTQPQAGSPAITHCYYPYTPMSAISFHRWRLRISKYDVAFSFAEEDRPFVQEVVAHLKVRKVRLFYDDHERVHTWGRNLLEYLDQVYRSQARFCVIFISKHYVTKRWTGYETEWARARAVLAQNKAYILPFRLDDTPLPGISDEVAYLSLKTHNAQQLAMAIIEKIAQSRKKRFPVWLFPALLAATALSAVGLSYTQQPVVSHTSSSPKQLLRVGQNGFRILSICKDGWLSQSHGSGTCSSHGGIDRSVDTVVYGESLDACRKGFMKHYQASK